MITPKAVALVLQAFAIGDRGDILVLDMRESMRILDLARSLIRPCGKFAKTGGAGILRPRKGCASIV